MDYDLCFIGAGPSTMFALLKLIQKGYKGQVAIVEKGKSLKNRLPSEVINGSFGSGTYSDSKLSSALDVGGIIPGLTQYKLTKYEGEILEILNRFAEGEPMKWDETTKFNTSPSTLSWNKHNTLHVGTDRGREMYKRIEFYISSFPNIHFLFETEVKEVFELMDGRYELILSKEPTWLLTKHLVLATGQKNTLPSKIINKFNLQSTPRAFQIGVRVEDQMNSQYKEIIKANYDFKFVKEYNYDNGVKVRIRTFCCNSGNAHTCAEYNSEGFVCFNGHAFKELDPTNNTVNYGIMCEVEGLDKYNTKEEQIELMQSINNLPEWKIDNFDRDMNPKPIKSLLGGFDQLKGLYPQEVIDSMLDFVKELNKIVDLSKAHYLYPETKLSGNIPALDYRTFETEQPHLYMIGDCAISRGIVKASYTGWKFAKEFIKSGN
jgi:uncharacterized FAD-dependent dehydrogenase